jgi:hypothetical protein
VEGCCHQINHLPVIKQITYAIEHANKKYDSQQSAVSSQQSAVSSQQSAVSSQQSAVSSQQSAVSSQQSLNFVL